MGVFDDSKGQKTSLSGLDNFDDDLALYVPAFILLSRPFTVIIRA